MRQKLFEIGIILLCYILQTTFIQSIALAGIVPNLMIIVPVLFGYMSGKYEGMFTGFVSGFLFDLFYRDVLGVNALLFMYLGYISGMLFFKDFYKDDIVFPIFVVGVGDVIYGFFSYVTYFLMRNRLDFMYYLLNIIIPEVVYTLFLTLLLYKIVYRIQNHLEYTKNRKERKYGSGTLGSC